MRKRSIISILLLCLFLAGQASGREKRIKVASVGFEGNEAFNDARLLGLMITRPYSFFARSYYHPDALEEDIRSIGRFYNGNGYLEAQVYLSSVQVDSIDAKAAIEIKVVEGELTTLEGISVFGARSFPDSLLISLTRLRKGGPFKGRQVQDGIMTLLGHYANKGFLDAVIRPDVRIDTESHRALVDIFINERGRSRIGAIIISGLPGAKDTAEENIEAQARTMEVKTRDEVVIRELSFHPGEVADYSKLLRSQRDLYMTGLFQSVFIRPVPSAAGDSTMKDIMIELAENYSIETNFYIGYGSVERGRARLELINNNLRGKARKIGLSVFASFINHGAEGLFSEPRTFGTRWKTDLNLIYEYREEPAYTIRKGAGRAVLGRSFTENTNVALSYRYENSELKDVKVESEAADLESDIRSLKLSFVYDSRDDLFNASRGSYLESSGEFAGSFLRGSEDFWKTAWKLKRFFSIGRSTVIASAFEAGWNDFFGRSTSVPLNERLYLGGPDVLRGFEYRKAGALDMNGEPVGGNFRLTANVVEIRQVVYRMVGIVAFFDAGGIWKDPSVARAGDLRYSPGLGVRVNTPIGIIRADYGFNIDQKDDEPAGHFYISVGHAF